MFDYIFKTYYNTVLCAAESGKMDMNAAHEVLGMVRLFVSEYEDEVTAEVVNAALSKRADKQWIARYACKPDADFARFNTRLSKWLSRMAK